MASAVDHPFVIDIRPCHVLPDRFVWTIKEGRSPMRHSRGSHPTFEEARVAARANLNGLVAGWLGRTALAPSRALTTPADETIGASAPCSSACFVLHQRRRHSIWSPWRKEPGET